MQQIVQHADNGRQLWRFPYPSRFTRDGIGPRATPTVAGKHVFTLGARGHLYCLEVATGKEVWHRDLCAYLGAPLPWWGFAFLGGLATVWLLTPTLSAWLGLPAGEPDGEAASSGLRANLLTWGIYVIFFLPGAVAGGALGWFLIRPVNWALDHFFRGFNWLFERTTQAYGNTVGWCLRLSVIVLLIYVGLIGITGFGFTKVPTGFIPSQDKGRFIANIQLPDSASLERTTEVSKAIGKLS